MDAGALIEELEAKRRELEAVISRRLHTLNRLEDLPRLQTEYRRIMETWGPELLTRLQSEINALGKIKETLQGYIRAKS